MYRKIMTHRKHIAAAIALFIMSVGCGGLRGEFAFKKEGENTYRRVAGNPEYSASETINWVFVFKSPGENRTVGVALMKKGLVWSDVEIRTETINDARSILYGAIANLEPGGYKLVIMSKHRVIGEKEFTIYDESREEDLQFE